MSNTNKDISSQILSSTGTDSVFLKGPFGSGKTTIGQSWYRKLLKSGIPADEILIFTPQRSLGLPYRQTVAETQNSTAGFPTIATIHGFSRRMIQTFWPVIFDSTLFPNPRERPVFLSIESVLYHMRTVLTPFIEKGYFKDLHLEPNRLFSQILDNLNKSAFIGLSLDEVFTRLSQTWSGDPSRLITYNQAKEAAQSFRDYCLNNSLLDASLQIEVFKNILWKNEIFRNYTKSKFHHILVDNVEEDVPVFHDILLEWLPEFKSALIIYDEDGGYRTFLGADPISGLRFSTCCNK